MWRHPSLQPLSREHHRALLCWRKLDGATRRPTDFDLSTVFEELRHYWTSRFEVHLQQEEKALLPLLCESLQNRMVRDHNLLRSLYERLAATRLDHDSCPNDTVVRDFAKTLREHIRWEERTVFPRLQEQLTDAELSSLFDAVAAADVPNDPDRCESSRTVSK